MDMKKNDIIKLTIEGMSAEGSGIGRTETGMAVFVPLSAVGDVLEVKILKVKKTYAFGKIEKVLEPSTDRIEVDCSYFNKCGGCVYRHISYEAEKRVKEQKVRDAVQRIGWLCDVKINPILSPENSNRYRNKAQLPVGKEESGKIITGFYAKHSHRIIDCTDCLLQPMLFQTVTDVTKSFLQDTKQEPYNEETHSGKLRHIYIRYGEQTGELMVCYVINGNGLKQEDVLVKRLKERLPQLKSVVINVNREKTNVIMGAKTRVAYGRGFIYDILCGLKFKLSPLSFYQVNRRGAELLYGKAKEYAGLNKEDILLDLYCGTGTIGLSMAKQCKKVIGIEVVAQAIEDAKQNAEENQIRNAEFICGDAAQAAFALKEQGIKPDVVIVDPPRKGLAEELIRIIVQMAPKRIVYVSCDPATLARDLRLFADQGYQTKELTPVDLFSRTSHVETVVLLSKLHTNKHIEVEFEMGELDLTAAESKATYEEIKEYVLDKYGLKVSSLNIAQIKAKCGIDERENYNKAKNENVKQPNCTEKKENAIKDAFKYFQMI